MKKLEKYLKGEAKPDEMETVTQTLIKKTVDQQYRQEWAKELASQHGVQRSGRTRGKIKPLYRWAAAVAASLVLGVVAWQLSQQANPTYTQLASTYLSEPFANNEVRKGEQEVGEWRAEAILLYNKKDYQASAQVREKVIASGKATEEDYFYQGLSYLYQQPRQGAKAIVNFQQALAQPKRFLAQESKWYLALAYLEDQQFTEARATLQEIVDEKAWNAANAQALLDALVQE